MATSKNAILAAIRQADVPAVPPPSLELAWTQYADRQRQFIDTVAAVGGLAVPVPHAAALHEQLRRLPAFAEAKKIVSLLTEIPGNVDLDATESPHDLADVDVAILPGEFGVAENGAVWVTNRHVRHRAVYYLCQHLVLVVPAGELVDHMHAAYQRLQATADSQARPFTEPMFGAFISGPSKTGDIEQALVIGAHGPLSVTVFLLGANE